MWSSLVASVAAADYLALALLDRVPFRSGWFLGVVDGLSLVAHVRERLLGRYRGPDLRTASSPTSRE